MDLIRIFQRFPSNEACIAHLESVRWGDEPACPHCGSKHIGRKSDGIGRWNCHDCHASFTVLSGTIFSNTRTDLPKWFLAISLVLNAKKSISSPQLGRDLDIPQKTAYRMLMKIRSAMVADLDLFTGIVEADECYVGGKPRKRNRRDDDDNYPQAPRGRATRKLPIVGVVERGGKVAAEPSPRVTTANLSAFLSRHVDRDAALLITDQFPAYRRIGHTMRHATVDHAARYVDGEVHVNTLEGFWALLKRAWWGAHHHYSKRHAHAYVTEACYKYNVRESANPFSAFLRDAVAA